MTPEQKELVRQSWTKLLPISAQAAALFYARLFEIYPEVKPLFKGDMEEQGRKLMAMINMAVKALDNLDLLIGAIQDSGRRHAEYGVKDEDYDKVADALLWTLEQGLKDDFTEEVKGAWVAVYTALADVMKGGAAEAAA